MIRRKGLVVGAKLAAGDAMYIICMYGSARHVASNIDEKGRGGRVHPVTTAAMAALPRAQVVQCQSQTARPLTSFGATECFVTRNSYRHGFNGTDSDPRSRFRTLSYIRVWV